MMQNKAYFLSSGISAYQVVLPKLKVRTGGVVDDDLTLEKVSVCVGDHKNSFLLLKSGLSVDKRKTIVSVLACTIS